MNFNYDLSIRSFSKNENIVRNYKARQVKTFHQKLQRWKNSSTLLENEEWHHLLVKKLDETAIFRTVVSTQNVPEPPFLLFFFVSHLFQKRQFICDAFLLILLFVCFSDRLQVVFTI